MRGKEQAKRDFDFFIDEYLYYCQSRRLRPKTLNSYEQTLRLFERWTKEQEGIASPLEVREQTIRHYICDLQNRGKYSFYAKEERMCTNCPDRRRDFREPISITTINNYIRNLRAFFNWFEEEYPGTKNPMKKIHLLENERKARDHMEDSEVRKLLDSFDKSYFPECRDATVITLILDSGMRLGECLSLSIDDIDLNQRIIQIPAEVTKGRKGRAVFFSMKSARALQRWIRFKDRYIETKYLFPTKATGLPVCIGTFETNFKNYMNRAGIDKAISPHALRNNFAKRCLMAGMDVYTLSRILGHSSVSVTEKAYLDLTDRDLAHRYQNFSPVQNLR